MSNQNPVNEPADYSKLDMADTEPPTFTLDARDRHALGALRDYKTRVAGDGVASSSYVRMVDDAIDLFVGWQSVNQSQVMSPDQPYRSAHDIDPAQRGVVENRADPLVAEDGEPSAMEPVVGTHPEGDEGTVAPPDRLDSPYVATGDPADPQAIDPTQPYQPTGTDQHTEGGQYEAGVQLGETTDAGYQDQPADQPADGTHQDQSQ